MDINVAIVGPGKIAERGLVPGLAQVSGAKLWSVLSRDEGRARAFADKFGAKSPKPVHTDLAALLADPDLHAVILASPDALHAQQGILAAKAGKHIFSEKPLCTDRREGEEWLAACERADVRLGVGYHLRWHAGHRALVERVHRRELGPLRHMRVSWCFNAPDPSNWRARPEVGRWWALAAVGTHALDLVRWTMVPECGEITELKSLIARQVHRGPHDETALLALRFANGATAEITTSVLFPAPTRVEIYGAEKYAICEGTLGPRGEGTIHIDDEPVPFTPVNPYAGELADFVGAIREKREPEVGGREGLRNVELLLEAMPRG
jgi:1,5-anhydro-D-fructose reductase (1,5-anhydro-D-mannitol-forming)